MQCSYISHKNNFAYTIIINPYTEILRKEIYLHRIIIQLFNLYNR